MRLLTRAEHEMLELATQECEPSDAIYCDARQVEILASLQALGRVEPRWADGNDGYMYEGWHATASGREALRIFPVLVERGLVP